MKHLALAVTSALALGAALESRAQETWRIATGDVKAICPLTVGGSFEAKTRSLTGVLEVVSARPLCLSGELKSDLRTLDTGIALRNEHLRDNYLEVLKAAGYETAVLSEIQLPEADATTAQGKTPFQATLRIHGVAKAVRGVADIKRSGASVRITARLPIHLPAFEIAKPRYLGVGVKDDIEVVVSFEARQEGSSNPTR